MRSPRSVFLAVVVGLAVPAVAGAASSPTASTQKATRVTASTARLNALVNPNGSSTTYSFQYGTSTRYGATTPVSPAGSGSTAVKAISDIGALKPNTTYHFRVVVSNAGGVTSGDDKTFRTAKQPLSLVIAANPNPMPWGATTTLTGTLSGTGAGGRSVQVQQKAFPYSGGWVNTGSPVVASGDGTFSTPVVGLAGNTQIRVVSGSVASAPIVVGVAPVVRTEVSTTRPRARRYVRFAGSVSPRWVPAQVAVQKQASDGRWITVAGTITHAFGSEKSRYAKRVRVRHSGLYRVFVGLADSRYAPAVGRTVKLRVR